MIATKYEESVDLQKGYHHGVYLFLDLNKEEDVNTNTEEIYVEADTEKQNMEDLTFDN